MVRRLREGTPYGKKRKARRAAPKAVREYIVANPKASVRSTAVRLGVSRTAAWRSMRDAGLHQFRAARCPQLSAPQKER
eukprot:2628028-Amphidinium_carterae.1